MMLLFIVSLLVTLCASASVPKSKEIPIDSTVTCGSTYTVTKEGTFVLRGTGNATVSDCSFIYEAEDVPGCTPTALCYMFDVYAFFENAKASLSIESGTEILKYDNSLKIPRGPVCTEKRKLTAIMREENGYEFNPNKPEEAYGFRLTIYNKCGSLGQVKNIDFEEAVKKVSGYHPQEEREKREHSTFVTGIVLGFGLACIFLIVLLAAYCYTRNSPNRQPGRSVGMPKVGGFKKKMKPNTPSGHKEVEMGVGYKAQDPDKAAAVPMLTGASDPEKPPVDTADDIDETNANHEPEKVETDLEKKKEAAPEIVENNVSNEEGDNSVKSDSNVGGGYTGSGDTGGGSGDTGGGSGDTGGSSGGGDGGDN